MNKPFFVALQYILPQHLLSRLIGKIMSSKNQWLKNHLIKWFIKRYQVDMSHAQIIDPTLYPTFNDFFIRHLQTHARPIDESPKSIVSPADGAISQIGTIQHDQIFQAKGINYSLAKLLGCKDWAKEFINGHFATVYLSPKDYHRVHMPVTGDLLAMRYIPGRLFSVNQVTADYVPDLFARNERAVCLFETEHGKMAVIMVGAMIVASIHTAWAGQVAPSTGEIKTLYYDPLTLKKGDEMGYFCLGSTAIVLFANPHMNWNPDYLPNSLVQMGQPIGHFNKSSL